MIGVILLIGALFSITIFYHEDIIFDNFILAIGLFLLYVSRSYFSEYPSLTRKDIKNDEIIMILSLFDVKTKNEVTMYFYEIFTEDGRIHLFKDEKVDLTQFSRYQMKRKEDLLVI